MGNPANSDKIVIIGGSAEARNLSRRLPGTPVWLPQAERMPGSWGGAIRENPSLASVLEHCGATVLVDASHPCDAPTAHLARDVTETFGVPLLKLARPDWHPTRRDRWVNLRREEDAARVIGSGSRILLATGHERLTRFANLKDCFIYARKLSPGRSAFPLPRGRFLPADAPFEVVEEVKLLRRLGIDWIILRNAGGPGGWPKLAAARQLGVQVALLRRPPVVATHVVQTVAEAITWLNRHRTWAGSSAAMPACPKGLNG